MLTREELNRRVNLFHNVSGIEHMQAMYENEIIESHLAALDEIERLTAELEAAKAENNVRDDALTCIADLIKYLHKKQPQGNTTGKPQGCTFDE